MAQAEFSEIFYKFISSARICVFLFSRLSAVNQRFDAPWGAVAKNFWRFQMRHIDYLLIYLDDYMKLIHYFWYWFLFQISQI